MLRHPPNGLESSEMYQKPCCRHLAEFVVEILGWVQPLGVLRKLMFKLTERFEYSSHSKKTLQQRALGALGDTQVH